MGSVVMQLPDNLGSCIVVLGGLKDVYPFERTGQSCRGYDNSNICQHRQEQGWKLEQSWIYGRGQDRQNYDQSSYWKTCHRRFINFMKNRGWSLKGIFQQGIYDCQKKVTIIKLCSHRASASTLEFMRGRILISIAPTSAFASTLELVLLSKFKWILNRSKRWRSMWMDPKDDIESGKWTLTQDKKLQIMPHVKTYHYTLKVSVLVSQQYFKQIGFLGMKIKLLFFYLYSSYLSL